MKEVNKNLFMFDVESTSLHGVGFAVGAVVYSTESELWTEVDRFELLSIEGARSSSDWVKENVLPFLKDMPTCETDVELRNRFFEFYSKHKDSSEIWSDVNFPVETNFLSAIVADDPEKRQWAMPYPLNDASAFVDVSIDRIFYSEVKRLRKHNPLDDSIASAICLMKSKQK